MKNNFFIWGNQTKELKEFTAKKLDELQTSLKKNIPDLEVVKLDCSELLEMKGDALDDYLGGLLQPTLFAPHLIAVARKFEVLNASEAKKQASQVLSYFYEKLAQQESGVNFIFEADSRKITEFKKDIQDKVIAHCETIRTLVTDESFDLTPKIREYAKLLRLNLKPDAEAALIMHAGTELETVWNEMEKLALVYQGINEPIAADEVHKHVGGTRSFSIFKIQDAVVFKDMANFRLGMKGLEADRGSDIIPLFAMLGARFIKLSAVAGLLAQGMRPIEVEQMIGGNSWLAGKLVKEAQHFEARELDNIVVAFSQSDLHIKYSSGGSGTLIFKDLCQKVIKGDFKAGTPPIKFCRDLFY